MKKIKYLLFIALFFAFTGCKSIQTVMSEKWNGKGKIEIVQEKGAPEFIDSDSNGGEILVYHYIFTGTGSVLRGNQYVTVSKRYRRKEMFFINPQGKYYNYTFLDEPLE